MLVVNASKRCWNGGKRYSKTDKKRGRFVYFYDSAGKFHTKRVTFIRYWWTKIIVKKYKIKRCAFCKEKFLTRSSILCDLCI